MAKLSDIHGGYYCAGDFAGSLSIRGLTRALCREALSGAGGERLTWEKVCPAGTFLQDFVLESGSAGPKELSNGCNKKSIFSP